MKFTRFAMLPLMFVLTSACGSAVEEQFDYSAYDQQASYTPEQYHEMAIQCSSEPNLLSDGSPRQFYGCKTSNTLSTTNIEVFSADLSVQKMCVYPAKYVNGVAAPIVLDASAPLSGRFLKLCGTITGAGSTAVISNTEFNGLLMVDYSDRAEFEDCLAQADFKSCATGNSIRFFEGLLKP